MPGLDGAEICSRLRQQQTPTPTYVILVTARTAKTDVVAGLEAGANDYITKLFDPDELRSRVRVGRAVTEVVRGRRPAVLLRPARRLAEAVGRPGRRRRLGPHSRGPAEVPGPAAHGDGGGHRHRGRRRHPSEEQGGRGRPAGPLGAGEPLRQEARSVQAAVPRVPGRR